MPLFLIAKGVWRLAAEKLLETVVSVKVWLMVTATFLLLYGKIGETSWVTIITTIGLGRVVLEAIVTRGRQKNACKGTSEQEVVSAQPSGSDFGGRNGPLPF